MKVTKGKECKTLAQVIERNTGLKEQDFLHPACHPYLYHLDEAVTLFHEVVANGEKIRIIGDYDMDGIAASVILFMSIRSFVKDVSVRLPKRFSEGYGLSDTIIDEVSEGLVITVDNGITAIKQIEKLKKKGVKVIVIDHHLPDNILPPADVIVDPHAESDSEFKEYCGAGLAYRFAEKILSDSYLLNQLLVLAGIATVTDMVPLLGANRYLVQESLKFINHRIGTDGLLALCRILDCTQNITEDDYGFLIGPVCNASGRLLDDGPMDVFRLLSKKIEPFAIDYDEQFIQMHEDARMLKERNEQRKIDTQKAMEQLESQITVSDEPVIVAYLEHVSSGIIGLVASGVAEKYKRPAFVFADTMQEGVVTGSARTYGDIHLKNDILVPCRELFLSCGGHSEAAGVRMIREKLPDFKEKLRQVVKLVEGKETTYDMECSMDEIPGLFQKLKEYAPFGRNNPKPVFLIKDYELSPRYGKFYEVKGKDTLKLYNDKYNALGRDMYQKYLDEGKPMKLNILVTLNEKYIKGRKVQMLELMDLESVKEEKNISALQEDFSKLLNFMED